MILHPRRLGLPLAFSLAAAPLACQTDVSWNRLTGVGSPGRRMYHTMAANPVLGHAITFGGLASSQSFYGDTWQWDGSSWSEQQPAVSPSPRYRSMMAFDPVNVGILMFGGYGAVGPLTQDTWLWNGSNWQQAAPATSPMARSDHMMASDLHRQRVVLFGGYPFGGLFFADTWEWDGATWTEVTPAVGPSRRVDGGMAYDAARMETVLFGGYPGQQQPMLQDTWIWDGTAWTQRTPATTPRRRTNAGMAYDPLRNVTVLCGGFDNPTYLDDTWEWDGNDWTQRAPLRDIAHWYRHGFVFDSVRGRPIAFGGYRITALPTTSEYGTYTSAPAFTDYGSGCAGSSGVPQVTPGQFSLPWAGEDWAVELRNVGPAGVPVLLIGLERAAAPIPGLTTCTLLTSADVVLPLANDNGIARRVESLPSDPTFVGVSLRYQAAVLASGAPNPWGLALSAGGEATVGAW
ncbi:MAG: hypothetical protein KDE27_09400 [Planctomycetes bacterium]|nr:hypothetical protein [Planctomycetota bacterium]